MKLKDICSHISFVTHAVGDILETDENCSYLYKIMKKSSCGKSFFVKAVDKLTKQDLNYGSEHKSPAHIFRALTQT